MINICKKLASFIVKYMAHNRSHKKEDITSQSKYWGFRSVQYWQE